MTSTDWSVPTHLTNQMMFNFTYDAPTEPTMTSDTATDTYPDADLDVNLYSSPESFGLEIVGTLDVGESYEFYMMLVLRDPDTGDYYTATDSGCSCPSPFENIGRDGLEGPLTLHEMAAALLAHAKNAYGYADKAYGTQDAVEIIARLRSER